MRAVALLTILLFACSSKPGSGGDDDGGIDAPGTRADAAIDSAGSRRIKTVFVIPLENKSDAAIYGNTTSAPYIQGLMASHSYATNFKDELPSLDSEPHYLWMEAGTNVFNDHTFNNDNDASAANSTASAEHLVTQLTTASIPWMSYQEGITSNTCPIASSGHYAPKHDPFVFFKDVAGSPPSASTASCASHHKSYADLTADLAGGQLTGYVFITPDLCHDMHGALDCPSGISSGSNIRAGDTWLSTELPRIITYAQTHDGVVFLTWDEGDATNLIPLIAIGTHVKPGMTATMYNHSSLVKTVEQLLGVPVLPAVASAANFSDMFDPGTLP